MTKLLVFIIFCAACIFTANANGQNSIDTSSTDNLQAYYKKAEDLTLRRYTPARNYHPNYYQKNEYGNNGFKTNRYPNAQLPGNKIRRAFEKVQDFNRYPYSGTNRFNIKNRKFQLYSQKVQKQCGVMKPQVRNYVANGEATTHSDWPWYVQIIIKTDAAAHCGGTLISEDYVLTAAHCFDEISKDQLASATTVLLKGIRIKNLYNQKYDEVNVKAEQVYLHPYYVPAMTQADADELGIEPGPKNDIAIIRIDIEDDQIRDQIIPACLPANGYQIPVNAKCKIMGHGFTNGYSEDNFVMPKFLQMADVYISENEICKAEVDSESIKSKINDDTLCIRGPIHPCVGDSGGPLICKGDTPNNINGETSNSYDFDSYSQENDKEWYLAGVTSFAVSTDLNDKCGLFKSAVFGKVANHFEWIHQVMRN